MNFLLILEFLTGEKELFQLCTMQEWLSQTDSSISIFLNHWLSPWLDTLMIYWSWKWTWLPLYAFLLFYLIRNFRGKALAYVLGSLALLILFSDQTASALFKPLFERLRPCHDPALLPLLRLPDGCGGMYGFASSHAANSMAVAVFFLLLPVGSRSRRLSFALIFWSLMNGWSRIYLGMHFAGDILCGFAIGAFWAAFIHGILRWLRIFDGNFR